MSSLLRLAIHRSASGLVRAARFTREIRTTPATAARTYTQCNTGIQQRWICSTRISCDKSQSVSSSEEVVTIAPAPVEAAVAAEPIAAAANASGNADSLEDSQAPPPPVPLFLRMPPIEGVGRCKLLRWLVSEGDEFSRGSVLCEIDSDLAVIEYKAQAGGILAIRRTKVGEKIVDGQILGVQVGSREDSGGAQAWLSHVERMARKEKQQMAMEERLEQEENELIGELERNTVNEHKSVKD